MIEEADVFAQHFDYADNRLVRSNVTLNHLCALRSGFVISDTLRGVSASPTLERETIVPVREKKLKLAEITDYGTGRRFTYTLTWLDRFGHSAM